jgi:hypothetical protein
MERKIIFGLVVAQFSILLVIITWIKLQSYSQGLFGENNNNYLFETDVYKSVPMISDTVNISIADLPIIIKDVIQKDSLINSLEIKTIKKISQKNDDFYDVCFKDTDYFNIMVLYDENGGIVYH